MYGLLSRIISDDLEWLKVVHLLQAFQSAVLHTALQQLTRFQLT